jgi:putative spermidine/putrescine transport system ATP-binding protein
MTPADRPYLQLQRLTKQYDQSESAVRDLSIQIARGEFVSLLGASGCGKTTTLRMIAGLIEPTRGTVVLDGADITAVPAYRRNIGVVFQSYALFPHLTVAENVAFGLRVRRIARGAADERVRRILALTQLATLGDRKPRELSGGQQQRVALARALVIEPTLLLLDEPLSNLDAKLRETMRDEIRRIQQELGITTIFITHDQVEALTISDRIAVMHRGAVEQLGTPSEIYERPGSAFVARFVGRINVFVAYPQAGDAGTLLISEGGLAFAGARRFTSDQAVEIMIRPHHVALEMMAAAPAAPVAAIPNCAIGRVEKVFYSGDMTQFHVRAADSLIVAEVAASAGPPPASAGSLVRLRWRDENIHYFQAS